jgi:hypothetical protein
MAHIKPNYLIQLLLIGHFKIKQKNLEQPQSIPITLGQHRSNPIGSTYPC